MGRAETAGYDTEIEGGITAGTDAGISGGRGVLRQCRGGVTVGAGYGRRTTAGYDARCPGGVRGVVAIHLIWEFLPVSPSDNVSVSSYLVYKVQDHRVCIVCGTNSLQVYLDGKLLKEADGERHER